MTNTPQWIQEFDKMESSREWSIHKVDRPAYIAFIQSQIDKAREEGFTQGFHASHEHEEGIQLLVKQAREEGRQEGYAEAGKVIDNISFSF